MENRSRADGRGVGDLCVVHGNADADAGAALTGGRRAVCYGDGVGLVGALDCHFLAGVDLQAVADQRFGTGKSHGHADRAGKLHGAARCL